ncbi:MAG: TraB/GumN family protein, partial [Tsuneonella sp.]
MIRVLVAVLGALALASCGHSDKQPELPLPKPALWTITAPDGQPAGWLFGPIHALPDGVKWRT